MASIPQGFPNFDTPLSPSEEAAFQAWKAKWAPEDSGYDYDLKGAFKAGVTPDPVTGHWPDTYKKPNHPTFSKQSIYAKYGTPGDWDQDRYITPQEVSGGEIARILSGRQPNAPLPAQPRSLGSLFGRR